MISDIMVPTTAHLTLLSASFLSISCATPTAHTSEDFNSRDHGYVYESPSPIFVVLGYATKLEYLGTADEYFEGYEDVVTTALASRVEVDIVSNVVGYTDRDRLETILLIGHPRDVDPKRGPIFIVGEETSEGVKIRDWGRPKSMLCIDADIAGAEEFPDFRVDEIGRFDPDAPRKFPKSNAYDFVLMDDDPYPVEDTNVYDRRDGRQTCFETEYGLMDDFADLKAQTRRKLKIVD